MARGMSLFRVSAPSPAVFSGPAVNEPLAGRKDSVRPSDGRGDDRPPPPPPQPLLESDLTRWIVRYRRILFGIAAFFLLVTFNGIWLIGRDSSLYRGLAHNLATGRG